MKSVHYNCYCFRLRPRIIHKVGNSIIFVCICMFFNKNFFIMIWFQNSDLQKRSPSLCWGHKKQELASQIGYMVYSGQHYLANSTPKRVTWEISTGFPISNLLTCQNFLMIAIFLSLLSAKFIIYINTILVISTTLFDSQDIGMGVVTCLEGLLYKICSSLTPTFILCPFLHSVSLTHYWDVNNFAAKAACVWKIYPHLI